MARRLAELVAPDSARKPLGYPGMLSNRMAGGPASRYTISASVPISSFQSAPSMRSSSPARSKRASAARSGSSLLIGAAERFLAGDVGDIADGRVAVDERARVERVAHAAHLVLDLEQRPRVARIDDMLEAPFVLAGLRGDQAALQQPLVRRREIGDVDRQVVAVVRGQRLRGLGKDELLRTARRNARTAVLAFRRHLHDFAVK